MATQTKPKTQTKAAGAQPSAAVTDSVENVVEFNEKTLEETKKAIEEFNEKAVANAKKAIEENKQAIEDGRKAYEEFSEKAFEENKKALEESQKLRAAYLDSYEKTVLKATDSYEEVAGATDVEWIKDVVAAQARATRELTKAYVNAARELDSQALVGLK